MNEKKINPRKISAVKDFSCVLPVLIFLAVFTYYPIVELLRISFTDWNLLNDTWQYVGFKNWNWLFAGSGNKYLWNSLKVTILYSIGELSITLIGGMIFALIFNRMTNSFAAMRAVIFTDSGIFNYLLSLVGIAPVDWLGDRNMALISVLMLTGWRCIGYGMMVYLSAMMGIATDYYEAAALDGANAVQRFFKITLPMLSPTTLFLFVTTFLSSMKVFQSVDILTQGGPYRSTEVFVYNIYRYAMVDFRMDRASTVGIFFFVLLLIITVATMKVSNGNVTYDS